MKTEWNIEGLKDMTAQSVADTMELIGGFVEREAGINLATGSGALKSSLNHKVIDGVIARIGSPLVYAAIHELGGPIKPNKAKALAIPIHPDAKGKSPRDFNDLVFIDRKGKPPLLVRSRGRGKNKGRMDVMFVLVKGVTLKPHPFLRPAYLDNKDQILNFFKDRL